MSAFATRRTGWSLPLGFGLGVVTVIIVLLVGTIVRTLRHVQPVRAKEPPVSAVVWGDRVFVGPGGLAHWLKVRGVGYSIWAGRHPPANHLLQREKAQRTKSKK